MSKYVNNLLWMHAKVKKKKKWYIHDLTDVLNNPYKFELNWIET